MTQAERLDFSELADQAERLASLALALDDTMGSGSSAAGYSGATHILSDLLHGHAKEMQAFGKETDEK